MMAWRVLVVIVAWLSFAGAARAHPIDPGLLRLHEVRPGVFGMVWKPPADMSRSRAMHPVLPASCHKLRDTGHESSAQFEVVDCGAQGLAGQALAVEGTWGAEDEVLVQVTPLAGASVLGVLHSTSRQFVLPGTQGNRLTTSSFILLGIEHILTGWDHLLFVLGLVLMTGFRKRLIGTITAFTVAHSVTLALAVLDVIRVPVAVIEALIALSVLLLAADLSRGDQGAFVFGRRYPWALAFGFGLLHGLGFAEALRSMSIPSGNLAKALLSFNAGVEIGQLGVVAALGAVHWTIVRARLRQAVHGRRFVVEAMGILAAFWFCQRVVAVWG